MGSTSAKTNGTIQRSINNGRTWPHRKRYHPSGQFSGYSDMVRVKGDIGLLVEWGPSLSQPHKEIRFLRGTAKLSPTQALSRGAAEASRSSEVVRGSGSLDVTRYGRVLKARGLVGVRGAGAAFDGLHYVSSVTHRIKPGEYKQSFELTRNGLISTLPVVPP